MKHLVLVGLMGAGKTTVGRECARRLKRPFVDTDDLAATLAGMAVPDYIAKAGMSAFREVEVQAVADVSASPEPLVIACGGGTVLDPRNRVRLQRTGTLVWLQASVATLAERVGDGSNRPLLAGDPQGALTKLATARESAYNSVADIRVDTAERSISEVADAVLAEFEVDA